jgi:hypothetical protein
VGGTPDELSGLSQWGLRGMGAVLLDNEERADEILFGPVLPITPSILSMMT